MTQAPSERRVTPILVWQTSVTDYFSIIEEFGRAGLRAGPDFMISDHVAHLESDICPDEEQLLVVSPPHGNFGEADRIAREMRVKYPRLVVASMQFCNTVEPRDPYHLNINRGRGKTFFDDLVQEVKHFLQVHRVVAAQLL